MATKKIQDKRLAEAYLAKLDISRVANEVDPFESKSTQNARIQRAQKDIVFMVETYLPHYATAACAEFHKEAASEIASDSLKIMFLEWFRGAAKSVWGDVIIPLWLWMRGEDVFLCLMSDSVERAQELLADVQSELEGNPLIIHDFGPQKCEGSWEFGNFFTTDQRFIGKAFGIKKKVRGVRIKQRRPNLWVIDDLETPDTIGNPKRMRKQAEQIERDILPTMTGDKRRLIYANNKFARVMTQTILQERHPDWRVHQVKAYDKVTYQPAWPAMYSAEYYKIQEKNMGIVAAYAEYLHESILQGKIFSEQQIQWGKMPALNEFKMIIVHWDIAYTDNDTSDYNACKAWGLSQDNNFWLIDCYVKQSKMKQAVAWMCNFKKQLPAGANVIFQYESQFWNGEVQRAIDEVEWETGVNLNLMKIMVAKVNKLMRIVAKQPYYQNSRIYYNDKLKSHADTQVGIQQLCAIEEGSTEHDDSPDADTEAIDALEKYSTPTRRNNESDWSSGRMDMNFKIM